MLKNTFKIFEYNSVFGIVLSLLLYNLIIVFHYQLTGFFANDFHLFQFAFTYQDCGFITRGLVPSIVSLFKLDPLPSLYILCNIFLAIYVYLIYYITDLYKIKNKGIFLIGFLFLFFGIPHFALDTLRLDIVYQTISLLIFILLHHKRNLLAFFLSILSLVIHEGAFFLLVPIFFLKLTDKKRWLFSGLLALTFLLIVFFANKITKEQAIYLAETKINMHNIPETYFIPQVSSTIDNALHVFKSYNMFYNSVYVIIYLILLFFSFKKLFTRPFLEFKWLCIFPILICFVAADWLRWVCFVYFFTMLYVIHYSIFTKQHLKMFTLITILLGIPIGINIKYGLVQTLLMKLFF